MAVGIGLLVLTVAASGRHKNRRPDPVALARTIQQGGSDPYRILNPMTQTAPKPAAPRPSAPTAKPVPSHSWPMPALEGEDPSDQEIVELAINERGTRALAKSKKQICLFDLSTGSVLQTFKPTPTSGNRKPTTDGMVLSPDARIVTTWEAPSSGQARVAFRNSETAQIISMATLEPGASFKGEDALFSPEGSTLLLPGFCQNKPCVQAISVADGARKTINLPVPEKVNARIEMLVPLPGRAAFVASWSRDRITGKHASRLSMLDLENVGERLFQSLDIEPWRGMFDRRLAVSADGKLVLAQDIERHQCSHFEVADLQNDTQLLKQTACDVTFPRACFTPDAKRVVAEWCPHYEIMHFNGAAPNLSYRESVASKLQLYEIASQKKLAEYILPAWAQTLAISGSGNKLAFSYGKSLFAVGFQQAFGVEPLPPVLGPADAVFTVR